LSVGLMGSEVCQDAARNRWIEPQALQRGDDSIAPEYGAKPGNTSVRIGAIARLGSHHVEIGQRTVQPVVELFIVSENLRFPSAGTFERSGCIVHDLFVRLALALRIAVHFACNCP